MTTTPVGWTTATLKVICTKIVDGSHNPPKPVNVGKPMLSARNVRDRAIHLDDFRYISEADFEQEHVRTGVQAGDVLLTIVGAIGRTAVVPAGVPPFALQRSVTVLRPIAMDARALSYALEAPRLQMYMTDNARGTAQKGIYLGTLAGIEIDLPPMREQQRIADKLDAVVARVDACRDRLARVTPLLKRFRLSVLMAAVDGRLTDDWRANRGLTWRPVQCTLGRAAEVVTGSTPSKKEPANFGDVLAFFKPSDLSQGYFVTEASEYLSGIGADLARTLPPLAVLVTCIGATIGKTGLARVPCSTNQQINALVARPELVLPFWLYFWCCSPLGQQSIIENASATTLPILNKSRFSSLEVDIPALDEQAEIVRRVDTLFAFTDRLEARLARAQAAADRLTPSLLAKAFRGELVPQDPADEPAAMLLQRLAASRPVPSAKARRPRAGQGG